MVYVLDKQKSCLLTDAALTSVDVEQTYPGRWRGLFIVFDSERSPKDHQPVPVSDDFCPTLIFESRFESGNLRQARRVSVRSNVFSSFYSTVISLSIIMSPVRN